MAEYTEKITENGSLGHISAPEGQYVRTDTLDIAPGVRGLGLAVDIGTTTVAAYLYDLPSGKCIATRGAMNAQRAFGSDVISRIRHGSTTEGLAALRDAIRGQISSLAAEMCGDVKKIKYVSIAGNTVMEHLLMGWSPESIGVAPFKPRSLFGMEIAARTVLPDFARDCGMYLCPALSGYVGGDITAGLLSSGACESDKTLLFIDIGTNSEMGIGDKNGFITCATAAGPAFEGGDIRAPKGRAAVRAGVETLLHISCKSYADVDGLLIAGGFGAYMNPNSACAIGLLLPELKGKLRHVGNSAGLGAALCLTGEGRAAIAALARKCGYVELSSSALFKEKYIEAMMFDE